MIFDLNLFSLYNVRQFDSRTILLDLLKKLQTKNKWQAK